MTDPAVPPSTEDVIARSTFRFAGVYVWAAVRDPGDASKHLMVAREADETTVVTAPENLASLDAFDVNPDRWLLLSIDCASPFYCVGFIAKIAARLSEAGMDILVVSTFSRDLVFVQEAQGPRAAELLREAGFAAIS